MLNSISRSSRSPADRVAMNASSALCFQQITRSKSVGGAIDSARTLSI
jgi:hypothetical protein